MAWEVAVAERAEALQAEDEQRTLSDYQALVAAGIPKATARRLSGYEGTEPKGADRAAV
jgi:hypothetical protein